MKKKVSKPNPLKAFNDNKAAAYKKAGGAMKSFKKSLPKAQTGKQTPFQQYMKIPGAVASDTVVKSKYYPTQDVLKQEILNAKNEGNKRYIDKAAFPPAKNPKNQKALDIARDKTYGEMRYGIQDPNIDESVEQYMRRMGPLKKGGSIKRKK
jgi:hypothetical protein